MNAYVCDLCQARITTINLAAGTTPFMLGCKTTPNCRGTMYSQLGVGVKTTDTPTHAWFRPPTAKGLPAADAEYVMSGGLLLCRLNQGTVEAAIRAARKQPPQTPLSRQHSNEIDYQRRKERKRERSRRRAARRRGKDHK